MRRLLLLSVALLMVFSLACMAAEEGLPLAGDLEGVLETGNGMIYYRLPRFEPQYEQDASINAYFDGLCDTAQIFGLFPAFADGEGDLQLNYEIVRNDERYLCVLLKAESIDGMGMSTCALNFARNGAYAGRRIDLVQALGLESEISPERLKNAVCSLIWEQVQKDAGNMDRGYLDSLTADSVMAALEPMWDFRLDESGNIVFMIQPGEIAAEMEGVLEYPFLPEELLLVLN